ncbi:MAG: citrate synthase, partial [Candidatus Hydrogenedentota bacterium]
MTEQEYRPGLDGVISNITEISYLDTDIEQIVIRGYDLIELIQKCQYVDVAYLLVHGKLPNKEESAAFSKELVENADIPEDMYELFKLFPKTMQTMDALRTGISFLGGYEDPDFLMDTSVEANKKKAMKILAKAPTICVNAYRAIHDQEFVKPDKSLTYTENFMYMIQGKKPDETDVRILDKILTAYIEHEMPNSTFTVRVIASTLSDIYGAISAAVASLKGPLHGGANEAAMKMFLEVKNTLGPNGGAEYIKKKLKKKKKVMGFG